MVMFKENHFLPNVYRVLQVRIYFDWVGNSWKINKINIFYLIPCYDTKLKI